MLLVQLQDQILHQHKLLHPQPTQLLTREQLTHKLLELLQLVILSNALLATNELVHPLKVLLPALGRVLHLEPDGLQGSNVDLDLVAQLIDESQQIQYLSHDLLILAMIGNRLHHHLIYVLLSQYLIQILFAILTHSYPLEDPLQYATHLLDIVSRQLIHETMDDVPSVGFHLITLSYHLTVLFSSVFV